MTSSLVTFTVGAGGVLVGAALVVVLQRAAPAQAAATKTVETQANGDGPASGRSTTEALLEAMRAQAIARAREAPSAAPPPAPSAPPAPPAETMDPVTLAKAEAALRDEKIAMHTLETRDGTWAPKMERALTTDLTAFGETQKFRPLSVECRSTSCLAQLEYPSYNEAFAARINVVAHPYAGNCAREQFFEKPDDPSAPFRAQMLFQCGEEGQE